MPSRFAALLVLTVLTGCAAERELSPYDTLSHRDPVDPDRETATKPYQSVMAGYHRRGVVEPEPWSGTPSTPGSEGEASQ
jgi:hypothetical protein